MQFNDNDYNKNNNNNDNNIVIFYIVHYFKRLLLNNFSFCYLWMLFDNLAGSHQL